MRRTRRLSENRDGLPPVGRSEPPRSGLGRFAIFRKPAARARVQNPVVDRDATAAIQNLKHDEWRRLWTAANVRITMSDGARRSSACQREQSARFSPRTNIIIQEITYVSVENGQILDCYYFFFFSFTVNKDTRLTASKVCFLNPTRIVPHTFIKCDNGVPRSAIVYGFIFYRSKIRFQYV